MGWLFGDSPQDQMDLVNEQTAKQKLAWDRYLADIKGQVEGSGYDFFAPKQSTTQSQTQTQSQGRTQGTSITDMLSMPEISGEYKELEGLARGAATDRLKTKQSLPPGYAETGVRRINEAHAGADAAARNFAASRGLSADATYGVTSPGARARAGDISDFMVEVPLAEDKLDRENINLAAQLTEMFGKGQRSRGTTTTDQFTQGTQSGTGFGTTTSPADIMDFLTYLGLMKPYETPIVVPQGRQGILGPLLGFGGQLAAGMSGGGGAGGGGGPYGT